MSRRCRHAQPTAAVPLVEVVRFTGESRDALLDLIQRGALEQVPDKRATEVTVASLRLWIADRR